MNFAEQEQKIAELKSQLEALNKQFDKTMKANNLTMEDLKNAENEIPAEYRDAWNKLKSTIEAGAKTNAPLGHSAPASKAGSGRRNAIRL
jgi:uncharacterized coiled-coil protein SlyX